jgi:hypothetical protein
MDPTRNPETDTHLFTDKAIELCMGAGGKGLFADVNEAAAFIRESDGIADAILTVLKDNGVPLTDGTILLLGSAVGEAIIALFSSVAHWEFSEKQKRWVVSILLEDGSIVEWNAFHKVEKRLHNGNEDSIQYWVRAMTDMMANPKF